MLANSLLRDKAEKKKRKITGKEKKKKIIEK